MKNIKQKAKVLLNKVKRVLDKFILTPRSEQIMQQKYFNVPLEEWIEIKLTNR